MLIACVQTDVQFGDVDANLKVVLQWLEKAAQSGSQLVVLPECMLTGYGYQSREEAIASAPPVDGPWLESLIKSAAAHNCLVVIGTLLRETAANHPRLTNSSLMIGPEGLIARYDKIHLPHLGVDRFVDRGRGPYQVYDTPANCRIGLGICYDSSFPEPMRALALAGADVIALGTNWPVAAQRTAEIVPPARSMENHLFFVAANRIGRERGFTYCGRSSICGPDGVELARAQADEAEILFADIDVAEARNKRIERTAGQHVIDRFADRRPEFYRAIIESNIRE